MSNEEEILKILKENQELIKKAYISAEKTRKYFLYMTILAVVTVVLPLIALMFIIPVFLDNYSKALGGLV